MVALAAAPTATLDAATKGYVDGLNIMPLNNGSLAASVASNILTLTLKTAGGATPSAGDPVRATFRNSTDADGSLTTRTITAATSMTFASGSTLGMLNGVAARIWVGLLDNAGTVEVCAWNPLKNTGSVASPPVDLSIRAFTPNTDITTTAEGSGTATSPHVLYSTNARSSVPFILLGFIEISEATAGVWATSPSVVQTYRDGMRKTGDQVQVNMTQTGAQANSAATIPLDDTIPQITEGAEYMTTTITPTSALNRLTITAEGSFQNGAGDQPAMALFQDATADARSVSKAGATAQMTPLVLQYEMLAGTTSATTFRIRGGANTGTTTFNGGTAARLYGGALTSFIRVQEIYV